MSPRTRALRRPARATLAAVLLPAWLALAACGSGQGGAIRNLLLVTFDTTRADRLGCTGCPSAHTPALDALASRGVLFDTCITPAPITLPSHSSLLTGLEPFRHGARNNGTHTLPERFETLAERLARAGFDTGAVVSAVVLDSRHGLDQGFDHYDDDLSGARSKTLFAFRETPAEDTARRALDWLAARGSRRWFLWVHFFDPHVPYDPPQRYLELARGSPYDGEISYADAQLATILAAIEERGEGDSTLVAMTSDHGESLGEHGEHTHGLFVHDATTRVPLILSHPALAAGKRVSAVVRTIDVTPTVLELLDVASGEYDGRSLARVALDPDLEPEPARAYSEAMVPLYNHGWSDLRALRDSRGRYVRAPRPELYDLLSDPRELTNLLPAAAERARAYADGLAGMLPAREVDSQSVDLDELDPKLRGDLEALGYAWSAEGVDLESPEPRADPKDMVESWVKTLLGRNMVREGDYEGGERVLREVLASDPASINARAGLALALEKLGRLGEALEQLRALTERPGNHARAWTVRATFERRVGEGDWRASMAEAMSQSLEDAHVWSTLGVFEVEEGRLEEARKAFSAALELDQRHAGAWLGLAGIEQKLGDLAAAEGHLARATECDPLSAAAWFSLGVLRELQQRRGEALPHYERAVELDPTLASAWLKLGHLLGEGGALERSSEAFEKVLAIDAGNYTAHYNLGANAMRDGRTAQALAHFRAACEAAPDKPDPWHKRMMLARGEGHVDEALAAARRLLELEPDHVQAMMVCALCLAEGGETEPALDYLRRALAADRERVESRARSDPELARLLAALEG